MTPERGWERVTCSMDPETKERLEDLRIYFNARQEDFKNNLSESIRMCIRFTWNNLAKELLEERYGRRRI